MSVRLTHSFAKVIHHKCNFMYNYILSFFAQSLASHSEEPIYSTPITTTVTLHVSPSIYAPTNALASTFSDVTVSPSIISPVSISLSPITTASAVHAPTNVLASTFSDVTVSPSIISLFPHLFPQSPMHQQFMPPPTFWHLHLVM